MEKILKMRFQDPSTHSMGSSFSNVVLFGFREFREILMYFLLNLRNPKKLLFTM